jgi:hypothetical protein
LLKSVDESNSEPRVWRVTANEERDQVLHVSGLKLIPVARTCVNGSCPTIYKTGRDSVVVQGYPVSADLDVPDGELLVEVPSDLIVEAARHPALTGLPL